MNWFILAFHGVIDSSFDIGAANLALLHLLSCVNNFSLVLLVLLFLRLLCWNHSRLDDFLIEMCGWISAFSGLDLKLELTSK